MFFHYFNKRSWTSKMATLILSITTISGCSALAAPVQSTVMLGEKTIQPHDSQTITRALDEIAADSEKHAVSVHKDYNTNTIIPDSAGTILDREATIKLLDKAQPGTQVEPIFKTIAAPVTQADLKTETPTGYRKLGEYSTRLPYDKGYLANIQLASDFLNNSVVLPGDTLSYNRITGFPTAERGYQPGPGIENGKVVQMYGGGICQVSTTLYNAVAKANLTVVERHHHSLPVSYVPQGQDAMVYIEENKDFIFKNNQSTPVIVKSRLHDGVITVTLFGK